jgi:hypothetical protein
MVPREIVKVRTWNDEIFVATWNWTMKHLNELRYIYL